MTLPSDISGLVLWLSAGRGVTLASGKVATWADQSGAGNDFTQAVAGLRPLFVADAGDGRPALSFDGVSQRFDVRSVIAAASAHSIIVNCLVRSTVGLGGIPIALGASANPSHLALRLNPTFDDAAFVECGNTAGTLMTRVKRSDISVGGWHQYLLRNALLGVEKLRLGFDTSDVSTTFSGSITTNRMAVGAHYYGGAYRGTFHGLIRDVLVFDRAITDPEWASIVGAVETDANVAPTISNFVPSPGSTISRSDPITFDVTDDLGLFRRVLLAAQFTDGTYEVVHDGEGFAQGYAGLSTRSAIPNGFRYRVRRSAGWPSGPTLTPFAIDTSGNENA